MTRVLAVDWGTKRIGIAVSDPTGVIAGPHQVIKHVSRIEDAKHIVEAAHSLDVGTIVVGLPTAPDGTMSPSARSARRLADAIQSVTEIPVVLWDESGSTRYAQDIVREAGKSRKDRRGHQDQLAAIIILQDYLEYHRLSSNQ